MTAIISGWALLLIGISFCAGGAWLALVGGSWAYFVMGAALAVTGMLLLRRHRAALVVYAALLVGTLIWALWEVGLDRWALIPRGALFALIGLWLLVPWVSRPLTAAPWHYGRKALGAAMVLVILTSLVALLYDPYEIDGELSRGSAVRYVAAPGSDWFAYGGTGYGQRYSALTDITPQTIDRLAVAWTYHAGNIRDANDPKETTFEVTPLKAGELLYICTPHTEVIALNALTGEERWRFDPRSGVDHSSQHATCRGVAYYGGAAFAPGAGSTPMCAARIFLPTIDARLIALDAESGRPCTDFGENGAVDLKAHMPHLRPGAYMQTSPPLVTRNLVIVGGSINDNESVENPSGVIRAFDVYSGRLVWNWDPGKPEQTAPLKPGEFYTAGGPNNWSIASVDENLGLVYVPMGNQSPDQIGIARTPEVERFSSAIVALDLETGRHRWVFQTVHHDLWDRDVPAQPTLVDLTINGRVVPALVAPTKQGDVYVLDRRSGRPLVPVQEIPVLPSDVPSETTAPTQPTSALSFMPPPLREQDMWGATPWDQLICRVRFRQMKYNGPYTAPSTQRTLVYPGNFGVFNWGGIAVDPVRQIMVGTPARLAFTYRLIPRNDPNADLVSAGQKEHWNENYGGQYAVEIGPFMSVLALPCQAPPWGLMAAADLRTGEKIWRRRNGTVRDQMPSFLPIPFSMGVASLGGPLITAGGVVFYSGTMDYYLRAYDVTDGKKLWEARLPAGGQATPMTYSINGKQMVVVAAGGHGSFGTKAGDAIVAYALR